MAVLNYSEAPNQGVTVTVILNKTELCAMTEITDTYFNTTTNISKVFFLFKSSTGSERITFEFACNPATTTDEIVYSFPDWCRDVFFIDKVLLLDFDGGNYRFTTSAINIDLGA